MTWEQIESSWKQLKGDLQLQTRTAKVVQRAIDPREAVEAKLVSYKRSQLHGTAYIRRRNPAGSEQAGWTAAR